MPTDDFSTVTPTTKITLEVHGKQEIVTVAELYSCLEPGTEPRGQDDRETLLWAFGAEAVG